MKIYETKIYFFIKKGEINNIQNNRHAEWLRKYKLRFSDRKRALKSNTFFGFWFFPSWQNYRKNRVVECIFDYMALHIECRFNKISLLQCYFLAILPAGKLSDFDRHIPRKKDGRGGLISVRERYAILIGRTCLLEYVFSSNENLLRERCIRELDKH